MRSIKTVTAFGIRHGEKKGDGLTERGFQQVAASALKYLSDVRPVLALHSGWHRAQQTVETALAIIGSDSIPTRFEQGFAFSMSEEECLPGPTVLDLYNNPPKPIEEQTVQDWLTWCTGADVLRGQVAITLIHVARSLEDGDVFIIGSHSPTIEMAVPNPAEFNRLNVADIVRYDIEFDDNTGFGTIVSAQYLKAPEPLAK